MAYQKTNWIDNETPINANNLNKMEQGIEDAAKTGGILAGTVVGWNGEGIPEGYEEVEKGYSTTEKLTGETWIDGKPLYRKVIKGTVLAKGIFLPIDLNYDTLAFERLSFVSSAGYTVTNGYYDNMLKMLDTAVEGEFLTKQGRGLCADFSDAESLVKYLDEYTEEIMDIFELRKLGK